MNHRSEEPQAHVAAKRRSLLLRSIAGFGVLVAVAVAATATATGFQFGRSASGSDALVGKLHQHSYSFGSVATAPNVSASFKRTFKDKFVKANGIRQHVVVGGEGPPLLLVHGWPENWYAWRYLMPELAKKYTVVAVDQRGIGLSERTAGGYDSKTLAKDLASLMTKLGHNKFAVVGHDTGMAISYALAYDFPTRVARVALAEIPGPPTKKGSPPAFIDDYHNDRLWHITFNRVKDPLIVDMIASNAKAYFEYEYKIQGGGKQPTDSAIRYYIKLYTQSRAALTAGLGFYRDWDITTTQNDVRKDAGKLPMPVLAIGGATSWGGGVGAEMTKFAENVQPLILPGTGHWVAENAPQQLLSSLVTFLEPYRTAP